MKKGLFIVIGLVSLVVLLAVLLSACSSGDDDDSNDNEGVAGALSSQDIRALVQNSDGGSQQTGIWVSGTGKVTVVPDLAILQLGVEAQAGTVAAAQSDAAAAMAQVVAALSDNGIPERDIQTQRFSIEQVTKWDEKTNEQIVIGYRVTNLVTAKIRAIDTAGEIIDAVALAGGDLTRIQGISFTVDDPEPYSNQARQEAILDAMAKAEQMSSVANVGLGNLIYMTESGYIPLPYYAKGVAEAFDASTPISAGELEISVTVQMVYAID